MLPSFSFGFSVLPRRLAVCRLPADSTLPEWARQADLLSVTWTRDELSIVLDERFAPPETVSERGWRALKVEGPLDFSQTGVLASMAVPLAEAGVSIFVLSTYQTDYILVRDDQLHRAIQALQLAGHTLAAVS